MFHYYRAYREVPASDWKSLHEVYAQAEKLGVAETDVKDYLNRYVHDSSPRIAYMRAVLMGMANPHELSQRQLTFVAFLLERWASKADMSRNPLVEAEGVPPLLTDLSGDRIPERVDETGREPWTWVRTHGKGRIFYTASGHDERVWGHPMFHKLIRNAILWAASPEARAAWQNLPKAAVRYAGRPEIDRTHDVR